MRLVGFGTGFVALVAMALALGFCRPAAGVGSLGDGAGEPVPEAPAHRIGDVATGDPSLREPAVPPQTRDSSEAMAALTSRLGPTLGGLHPRERDLARETIRTLQSDSERELARFQDVHARSNDPLTIASEASLLRTAALWKAVGESLDRGQYWLGRDYPTSLPRAVPGTHYQALTVVHDGTPATAVFYLEAGGAAEYNGVVEYHAGQRRFWLQEAARTFNGRSFAERRALFDRFVEAKSRRGLVGLDAEMAHTFPLENQVDERTMLMYAPR